MNKIIQKHLDESKKSDTLYKKENELLEDRINTDYENLQRRKEELAKAESIDLSRRDGEYVEKLRKENKDYLTRAKKSGIFLVKDFKGKVPYFAKNIILAAGLSGDGKSTTCANIAYRDILQNKKVLVITNEEIASDVYNRVTSLIKGWAYREHENFTEQQHAIFDDYIDKLSHRLTVIDDSYNDSVGQTSTIEGMEAMLESLLKSDEKFDVIIIDYYQNIDRSTKNPGLSPWQVQEQFAKRLDKFKNVYEAPIVVLAQLTDVGAENKPFKDRIEGRKIIYNVCTCALEVMAERENLRTAWKVRKSRWSEAVGQTIMTGFNKGLYVDYTPEFQASALALKESKERQKMLKLNEIEVEGGA